MAGTVSMFFLDRSMQVWVRAMNFSGRPLRWISWLNTSLILMLAYTKVAYFSFYFLPLHFILTVKLIEERSLAFSCFISIHAKSKISMFHF